MSREQLQHWVVVVLIIPRLYLLPALMPLYAQMTPDTYGGAVLLGVDGICIISHGSSGETAVVNALNLADELVKDDLVAQITAAFAS